MNVGPNAIKICLPPENITALPLSYWLWCRKQECYFWVSFSWNTVSIRRTLDAEHVGHWAPWDPVVWLVGSLCQELKVSGVNRRVELEALLCGVHSSIYGAELELTHRTSQQVQCCRICCFMLHSTCVSCLRRVTPPNSQPFSNNKHK